MSAFLPTSSGYSIFDWTSSFPAALISAPPPIVAHALFSTSLQAKPALRTNFFPEPITTLPWALVWTFCDETPEYTSISADEVNAPFTVALTL